MQHTQTRTRGMVITALHGGAVVRRVFHVYPSYSHIFTSLYRDVNKTKDQDQDQDQNNKTKTAAYKTKTKTDFLASDRSCPKTAGLRPFHWSIPSFSSQNRYFAQLARPTRFWLCWRCEEEC